MRMIDLADGDITSMPFIQTISSGSEYFRIVTPHYFSKKKLKLLKAQGDITRSQSMFTIFSFLRKAQTVQMQQLSRRFYNSIIPQFIHNVQLPLPP